MNDLPRQTLCDLLRTHGRQLCDQPERCATLLTAACPGHPTEIDALVRCLRHGVANDLLLWPKGRPGAMLSTRLIRRLVNRSILPEEAAAWAVESWTVALESATTPPAVTSSGLTPDSSALMAALSAQHGLASPTRPASRRPLIERADRHRHEGASVGARAGLLMGVIVAGVCVGLGLIFDEWPVELALGYLVLAPLVGRSLGGLAGRFCGPYHPELASGIVGAVLGSVGGALLHDFAAAEEIPSHAHQAVITGLIGLVVGALIGLTQRGLLRSLTRLFRPSKQSNNDDE